MAEEVKVGQEAWRGQRHFGVTRAVPSPTETSLHEDPSIHGGSCGRKERVRWQREKVEEERKATKEREGGWGCTSMRGVEEGSCTLGVKSRRRRDEECLPP